MSASATKLTVFVASPLEPWHVRRIASVAPDRLDVVYEPDLLPPPRYAADHGGEPAFQRTVEQEARWRANLGRADILWDFPGTNADGGGGLEYAPNVKWVQSTSSGVGQRVKNLGQVDTDLLVTTARGVHAGPLAEFVFLCLLSHVKRLRHVQAEQAAHRWERFCGDELDGKTLAIVGAGGVGQRVASIGRCFGMRVVALARPGSTRTATDLGVDELFASDRLHEMLSETDALVLSVPHTPDTEAMIDRAALDALKEGAGIVNVARGLVIDELALIEKLRAGTIAFAGLDVFATEPLPADSPLWDLPNVLISPHSMSTVARENERIADIFCHNLMCYLDGRVDDMRNVLDKSRLY